MKCRNCGHDNPEYSEVCENCAVSLRSEPQRDDDTPSWGFVDENKDIRFSFGGRNAAQNNNPAGMNQNTDSDLDELERQFTCDVGDWNEVQRRPNASRQKNNRQNAAAAQRNDRTSSPNGAERANRSSAQNTRAHSPVTDFRGITILQTHAGSSPARKGSQTRMTNMIPMISMMRMHTTAANAGTSARRSSAERAEIRLIFKMISTLPARVPITEQSGADAMIHMMNLKT